MPFSNPFSLHTLTCLPLINCLTTPVDACSCSTISLSPPTLSTPPPSLQLPSPLPPPGPRPSGPKLIGSPPLSRRRDGEGRMSGEEVGSVTNTGTPSSTGPLTTGTTVSPNTPCPHKAAYSKLEEFLISGDISRPRNSSKTCRF